MIFCLSFLFFFFFLAENGLLQGKARMGAHAQKLKSPVGWGRGDFFYSAMIF